MPITLVSSAAHMQTFNLTPGIEPVRMIAPRHQKQPDGGMVQVEKRYVLPGSLTLMAKGTKDGKGKPLDRLENLPDEVEKCPEVQAALLARKVRIDRPKPVAETATPESTRVDVPPVPKVETPSPTPSVEAPASSEPTPTTSESPPEGRPARRTHR
jgi:hypothetical protein